MTRGLLVEEFDLWQPTYAGAVVNVYQTGTTTPATLFFDEDMTDPAPNPQTLISFTDESGIEYGRFFRSVYSQQAYYLDIGTLQQTGNHRLPLADLVGVDASQAVATATGATQSRTLAAHFADVINVQDFGAWKPTTDGTASPATNNATLTAAIGAAAAQGGGFVVLPAGSYEITGVNVPGNVMICGRGKGVSTLVCKTGAACFTVTGDKAGFRDVTLDGVDLVASSIGLTGNNRTGILLERCEVKRFETGILFRGGSRHLYKELFVGNCTYNVRLLGDSASSGGAIFGFDWHGGQSITATNTAIELHQVDQTVQHIRLRGVSISSNTPSNAALYIEGCQFIDLENCIWESNTGHNVWLRDDVTTSL